MDQNEEFMREIFRYFIDDPSKYSTNNVIKRHTEKLSEFGDYSFPLKTENWIRFLSPITSSHQATSSNDNIFAYRDSIRKESKLLDDHLNDLVQASQNWPLTIDRVAIRDSRCAIFLNRHKTFRSILTTVLQHPNYGRYEGDQSYVVVRNDIICADERDLLTKYRCRIVGNVIENLVKHSTGPTPISLYVTHKSTDPDAPPGCTKLFVGNVTSNDNKLLNVEAEEYLKKRSVDMQLMAQHKYGLRVKNEEFFKTLIDRLGKAAVTIDLLEAKPSSSVKLVMTGCPTGRSKGAAFILYNSARIETLLKKYDHGVATRYYPETLPFECVDFGLLKEEDEWTLLFDYVLSYPSLIAQIVGHFHKSLHLLCLFLSGLVSTFSVYYARTRILTENRPHLLPVLHARIYLLRCIRLILNKCLAILNIDPVEQM